MTRAIFPTDLCDCLSSRLLVISVPWFCTPGFPFSRTFMQRVMAILEHTRYWGNKKSSFINVSMQRDDRRFMAFVLSPGGNFYWHNWFHTEHLHPCLSFYDLCVWKRKSTSFSDTSLTVGQKPNDSILRMNFCVGSLSRLKPLHPERSTCGSNFWYLIHEDKNWHARLSVKTTQAIA